MFCKFNTALIFRKKLLITDVYYFVFIIIYHIFKTHINTFFKNKISRDGKDGGNFHGGILVVANYDLLLPCSLLNYT